MKTRSILSTLEDSVGQPPSPGRHPRSRMRMIALGTLGMFAVGLSYILRYAWLDVPALVWTNLIGISLGCLMLVLLWRTGRATLCGNLATGILFGVLVTVSWLTGGHESSDFSWLLAVPAAAAFVVGLRAAWAWLGVVWVTVLVFWSQGPSMALDLIPVAARDLHSLQNRLGLSLALVLLATLFLRALRAIERQLEQANDSLALEIESRRAANQALLESETKYRNLIEKSTSMIFTHDLAGRFLSANQAFAEFFGCEDPGRIIGTRARRFLSPESSEVDQYLQSLKLEGSAVGLLPARTESGEEKLLEVRSSLRTESGGEPVVHGVGRDVTESERARGALLRQVEQEALVSEIATRFISVDGDELRPAIEIGLGELGSFAGVDRAALHLVSEDGKTVGETYLWRGDGLRGELPKPLELAHIDWLGSRLAQLETVIIHDLSELEARGANHIRTFLGGDVKSAFVVPLVGRDGLLGILSLVQTLEQRQWPSEFLQLAYISGYVFTNAILRVMEEERALRLQKEIQQARKMESLGLVAGGIAHDFNNHLMGILGNAGLLQMRLDPTSENWEAVEQLSEAARRASKLTSQMLSYSGSANMSPEVLELDQLLIRAVASERAQAPAGVELDVWLAESVPQVEADPGQIRQVVRNLLVNSIEAMEGRGGRIQLRSGGVRLTSDSEPQGFRPLKTNPEPGTYALIQVSDSGCGVAAEDLPKMFDPFFSTRFQGRGLGLAAVHGIVRAHNGVIEVASEAGRGTTIRILLPASEDTESLRAESAWTETSFPGSAALPSENAAPVLEAKEASRRGAILVVDDEESIVQVVTRMLELSGFEVLSAASEEQVLKLAKANGHDVQAMLLDFSLPQGDVSETLKELQDNGLEAPVIMMSGFPSDQMRERVGECDVAGFLEKPFGSESLLSELERVLEQ